MQKDAVALARINHVLEKLRAKEELSAGLWTSYPYDSDM